MEVPRWRLAVSRATTNRGLERIRCGHGGTVIVVKKYVLRKKRGMMMVSNII